MKDTRITSEVVAREKVALTQRRQGADPKFNWKLSLSCGHTIIVPGNSTTEVGHVGPCPRCNGL